MCIGMANGGKECINEKSRVDDLGRVYIPKVMRKKLKLQEGDILRVTALTDVIVIEKCEDDTDEQNDR